MPPNYTYPGVYISELPSGAQAVPAAATSIALFVGMAEQGPMGTPVRVQGWQDFVRNFSASTVGEMADQVAQFFFNGGGDAFVMRIAKDALQAAIDIQNEAGTGTLTLTARDAGAVGGTIQASVDYATSSPERTFNLTVWRAGLNADGTTSRSASESFPNLSMDPDDPRFVETVLTAQSLLVRGKALMAAPAHPGGASISGLIVDKEATLANTVLTAMGGSASAAFSISIARKPPVMVSFATNATKIVAPIKTAIILACQQTLGIDMTASLAVTLEPVGANFALQIQSSLGPVVVTPASSLDCSVALQLGTAAGGIELDAYSQQRPAQSGVFATTSAPTANTPGLGWLAPLTQLAALQRSAVTAIGITDPVPSASIAAVPIAYSQGSAGLLTTVGTTDSFANLAVALDDIAAAINTKVASLALACQRWNAVRQGLRLVLVTKPALGPGASVGVRPATTGTDIGTTVPYWAAATTLAAYTLGSAVPGLQGNAKPGSDGSFPVLQTYADAFDTIDSTVEIFNMLILPRVAPGNEDRSKIWGAASAFATKRRAILLVDPASGWTDVDSAEKGADSIKVGIDTRNSALYWPPLRIPTASGGLRQVDPAGSLAGLYARTDQNFGTWKAPAGIEATLTNVLGLAVTMSDDQNGRLNPKAMNAIRLFPSGITSWGARTLVGADDTGNVDDKYINVRRMALFIENSLYRGLRFAAFKNNAEPLWASIRLAAGSFMNGLMVQGAFAASTKKDAYYVLCDSTTTTANDVNLGIVNVLVGFAPNKPAEFVHLTVTQIAGQIPA